MAKLWMVSYPISPVNLVSSAGWSDRKCGFWGNPEKLGSFYLRGKKGRRNMTSLQMHKRLLHARENVLSLLKKSRAGSCKFKLQGDLCPEAEGGITKASGGESWCFICTPRSWQSGMEGSRRFCSVKPCSKAASRREMLIILHSISRGWKSVQAGRFIWVHDFGGTVKLALLPSR